MAVDLSVILIVKNEQANIRRVLESVKWLDDIIIVDSGSTDNTVKIAREYTNKIYHQKWLGYGRQKQYALSLASKQWVLSLDADEELSNELKNEIANLCSNTTHFDAYKILRRSYFGRKMICYGDWKKDQPIRLFKRQKAQFSDDVVHERVIINGNISILKGEIYHYTYNDISDAILKANEYSTLSAKKMFKDGKRASILKAVLKSLWAFSRSYIIKFGFLDGKAGFMVASSIALNSYLKYLKLVELNYQMNRHLS